MRPRHAGLVNAIDLVAWAGRRDSQATLPKLLRRLALASAPGISRVAFRADEGVQLGGWDGVTIRENPHSFVPDGISGWELTVRRDTRTKADEDYASRSANPDGFDPKQTAFVFVTLRRWSDKQEWAASRSAERVWQTVVAYDADDLETWLEQAPAVHVWISTLLRKQPEGAVDLDTFWNDWSQATDPALTPTFLLAGRSSERDRIQEQLRGPSISFAVRAESREEALAVMTAAIYELPEEEREQHLARSVVVYTRPALDQVAASDGPLLIIPMFDDAEAIARAVRSGHRVAVPLGAGHQATATTIVIPRLSYDEAERALVSQEIDRDTAARWARLGRRSLMALRRKIAVRPEVQHPVWARPENAPEVLPFFLAGSWNDTNKADLAIVASLAQSDAAKVQESAKRWARESNPLLRAVGSVWYLVSKEDAWELLSPGITRADLERFEAVALAVLGATDPRLDVPAEDRWFSFERLPHSGALRTGIAETLAVMGARGERVEVSGIPVAHWAARIVRLLLERANNDWRLWASLSHHLSLLAEAAPEEFLSAVERGLTGDRPLLNMFQERGDPLFSSSPHTGLLWALERLCWSPDHLARATLALARLAALDPGGNLGNRPRNSLRETFLLWHPQTAAPWERQLTVLGMVLEREPTAGWALHADLLPKFHDSSTERSRPDWREWVPDQGPTVTIGEHVRHVRDVVHQMLAAAGEDGTRWSDLVEAIPNLPDDLHEAVISSLERIDPARLTSHDLATLQAALRQVLAHHRSHPDADWAMPAERLDRLDALYERFEPPDPLARFGWLFADHVRLPDGRDDDWEAEERAIAEARRDAVVAVHRQGGTAGVEALIGGVDNPYHLGGAFGASGLAEEDEATLLRKHLAAEDSRSRNFGRGFVFGRGSTRGSAWVEGKLGLEGLAPAQKAELLVCLPSGPRVWEIARRDPAVDDAYWREVYPFMKDTAEEAEYAARSLARVGRAFVAAERLAFRLKDPSLPSSSLIADVLEAALKQDRVDSARGSVGYWIGQLLDTLAARADLPEQRVAQLEWAFAVALDHDRPLKTLHRELSRNPDFVVELISFMYRAQDEEPGEVSDEARNRASVAFRVLNSWKGLPGTDRDGTINVHDLEGWVTKALAEAAARGLPAIGAQEVGKVLSHSPSGTDGAWPHEAVRDVIERLANDEVESGFRVGKYNSRGVVTRGIMDGGRQERALADQYGAWAKAVGDRWPRTGVILRQMEARYRDEARMEDAEAELRKDGMW